MAFTHDQLWGDVGLRDILIDSGVYESATVMSGKHYKLAVCGLISMMYEALMTCYMMSFSSGVRMYSWKQWKETSEIVI